MVPCLVDSIAHSLHRYQCLIKRRDYIALQRELQAGITTATHDDPVSYLDKRVITVKLSNSIQISLLTFITFPTNTRLGLPLLGL